MNFFMGERNTKNGEKTEERLHSNETNNLDFTNKMLEGVPRYVCITVVVVAVIQAVTIIIALLKGTSGTVTNQTIENIFSGSMLTIGVGIMTIVASVWVGLNIYSTIANDEIEKLNVEISETKKQSDVNRETVKSSITEFESQVFILKKSIWDIFLNKMDIYSGKYYMSQYFREKLSNRMIEDIDAIYELIGAEKAFLQVVGDYERDNWGRCVEKANRTLGIYEGFYNRGISEGDIEVENYILCRIADIKFYKNASLLRCDKKSFSEKEIIETISQYENMLGLLTEADENENDYKNVIASVQNIIGYSYDLINQEKAEYLDEANKYMGMAVKNITGDRKKLARYLRNYGLTFERKKDYESAERQYKLSLQADASDYKSYSTFASIIIIIIKQIENKSGISTRADIISNLNIDLTEWEARIKEALLLCEQCMRLHPLFEDAYYKCIQIYTFLFLLNTQNKEMKEMAQKYIELMDVRGFARDEFLYAKRNYYEAIGDIDKASEVNGAMNNSSKNSDVVKMAEIYGRVKNA